MISIQFSLFLQQGRKIKMFDYYNLKHTMRMQCSNATLVFVSIWIVYSSSKLNFIKCALLHMLAIYIETTERSLNFSVWASRSIKNFNCSLSGWTQKTKGRNTWKDVRGICQISHNNRDQCWWDTSLIWYFLDLFLRFTLVYNPLLALVFVAVYCYYSTTHRTLSCLLCLDKS